MASIYCYGPASHFTRKSSRKQTRILKPSGDSKKRMGYRGPLQIENLHSNQIVDDEDEVLMLKLVEAEVSYGAMTTHGDVVTALFRVAFFLTPLLRRPIRGIHMGCALERVRKRVESFNWFKARPGVYFVPHHNRVMVSPDYFDRYEFPHEEPVEFLRFRLNGLPNYLLLYRIFTEGSVGKLDMQWVISRLNGGDPKWSPWSPSPISYWWWDP